MFLEIDNRLLELDDEIKIITNKLSFEVFSEFILNQIFLKSDLDNLSYPGVYLIEI